LPTIFKFFAIRSNLSSSSARYFILLYKVVAASSVIFRLDNPTRNSTESSNIHLLLFFSRLFLQELISVILSFNLLNILLLLFLILHRYSWNMQPSSTSTFIYRGKACAILC
jgi:hypothetical protein